MSLVEQDAVARKRHSTSEFELVRLIGSGGMAQVHLARPCDRAAYPPLVALKRIRPQLRGDKRIERMFVQEGRLARRLKHPNIVEAIGTGHDDEGPFIVMEYLDGVDLKKLLVHTRKTGVAVTLGFGLYIVRLVAKALDYAHTLQRESGESLEIVHRDISPANISITRQGSVKLIDFGVASNADRDELTRTGVIKGKLSYMAPEQCTAGALDLRSDLFALTIVLYEVTTGRRLFKRKPGEGDFALMQRIVDGSAPSPSKDLPDYPGLLEDVIARGLARPMNARFQSAREFVDALEQVVDTLDLQVSSAEFAEYMQRICSAVVGAESSVESRPLLFAPAKEFQPITRSSQVVSAAAADPAKTLHGSSEVEVDVVADVNVSKADDADPLSLQHKSTTIITTTTTTAISRPVLSCAGPLAHANSSSVAIDLPKSPPTDHAIVIGPAVAVSVRPQSRRPVVALMALGTALILGLILGVRAVAFSPRRVADSPRPSAHRQEGLGGALGPPAFAPVYEPGRPLSSAGSTGSAMPVVRPVAVEPESTSLIRSRQRRTADTAAAITRGVTGKAATTKSPPTAQPLRRSRAGQGTADSAGSNIIHRKRPSKNPTARKKNSRRAGKKGSGPESLGETLFDDKWSE